MTVPNDKPGFCVDRLFQILKKKTSSNYVIFEITERQKVQKPLFSLDYLPGFTRYRARLDVDTAIKL